MNLTTFQMQCSMTRVKLLKLHYEEDASTDSESEDSSYLCSRAKCGQVFDSAKELKRHEKTHKVKWARDGRICCDEPGCKHHYGTKRALQRHKKNNHDTSGRRYYCTEKLRRHKDCVKSYPTEQQLKQHIRGIHSDGFVSYCGKHFTWPLDRHKHQLECTKCKKLMKQ